MKKIFTLSALVAIIFASCTSQNENDSLLTPNTHQLQACFADDTRTYVENNKYLRWHEDDRLTAFYGNTLNRQYKFNGKTGDNSGTFSLIPSGELGTGNAFDRIYALYPYNETATITDEGEISLTLPAVQNYAENSFGKGANTMLAVTENLEDTFLAFKNACGYLKLKLYAPEGGVVKSIELKGNNGEKIAGAATATIAFGEAPVVTMSEDATTSITLDCGEGVILGTTAETATEFWVVVPETTFAQGITINVIDEFGGIFTKSTDKEITIERNSVQPMVALEVVCERTMPANNEIWYTSTDGAVVKPYATDVFGANIVSNTYENGKGVITFDGDITTIGQKTFYSLKTLANLSMPNSVTEVGSQAFYNCSSLTKVAISNNVISIGSNAFYGCTLLSIISIPESVTSIGNWAFGNCSSLTSATIPDGVTSIGNGAFSGCSLLTSVTIPDSVISIGSSAFRNCTSLLDIDFPNTIMTIGEYAFYGCTSLKSVEIPLATITTIEQYTFYGCSLLESVNIQSGVTTINTNAFNYCENLTMVDLPYTIEWIDTGVFTECPKLKSIYCRAKSRPAIYYFNQYNKNTFPLNADMKIYVPRGYEGQYTAGSGYSDKVTDINWYGYKSYIEPYDFE